MSEAASSIQEKVRRDEATVCASLEKEYRHEINSLSQKLKSGISLLESIQALRDADAKNYQGAFARDQQRIADLEK